MEWWHVIVGYVAGLARLIWLAVRPRGRRFAAAPRLQLVERALQHRCHLEVGYWLDGYGRCRRFVLAPDQLLGHNLKAHDAVTPRPAILPSPK